MQLSDEANAELLAQIGDIDVEAARRLLHKYKGDMQKAVDALLAGDKGYEEPWEGQHRTTPEPSLTDGKSTAVAPHASSSVIDLSGDDDLSRALQMSMQDSSTPAQFKPTERAPHPEWQVVLSNAPVQGPSNQDRTLDDAIQASLQDFNKEEDASAPPDLAPRQGGRPIALRPKTGAHAYATLVLQALYHVPQIRSTISTLRLPRISEDMPVTSPDRAMWNLIELFTNLDLAQLAFIYDASLIPSLQAASFDSPKSLGEYSGTVVKNVNQLIEDSLKSQAPEDEDPERLMTFTHGRVVMSRNDNPPIRLDNAPEIGQVVAVNFGGDMVYNDLVSCMEHVLSGLDNENEYHDVIIHPADVIVFQLARLPLLGPLKPSHDPFVYPKTFFLDRFLFSNFRLVHERRSTERKLKEEIEHLKQQRESLTRANGRDTLADLRSTLFYYENVAEKGDELRARTLDRTIQSLQDILSMINAKIEDIDHRVRNLQTEVASLFNCPELQQCRYDLRSVLMHTGLPGRKQMYSYVQDVEGAWWKTVDYEVTQVPEETVFADTTGLHLGAGPYMLIYSRQLSDELLREPLVWPSLFSSAVEGNNKKFLAAMHPELNIFTNPSVPEGSSQDPVVPPRELPIPGNSQARTDREGPWSMTVD
ncbi:hypothetical protein CPB83DRAFT_849241 [Crepidotus variabilis]|uniref:Peptidase C19 ubiquitin carboxyl-terminal hydrolase domain-containing protein n=1 Tax=Crepidotus variabilis TaxID=179855 RepID=A0A9P6JSK8_9AGAR|nr:hypothetical protein CPB83DRAFT_849241 [Crepidotus variabilis]